MFYKIIAKILSYPFIHTYLINKAGKTPYTHIYGEKDGELYMERYWLFNPFLKVEGRRSFKWFPLSIRIHKIMKEDNDRHLHDHPWNARTFILKGWYQELRPYVNTPNVVSLSQLKAGDTARLNFGEYHRISEVCEEGAYTMFVTGRYQGTWGFLVKGVKIKYREYLNLDSE